MSIDQNLVIMTPMPVTDAEFVSSNITEDEYPEWDSGTTNAAGGYVLSTSTHRVYESVQGSNLNNNPTTDDGTWWLDIRATNRWSAFDNVRSNKASNAESITYSIVPTVNCDAIGFFGLLAGSIRIEIWDDSDPAVKIYDETTILSDTEHVIGYYTGFFGGVVYRDLEIIDGFEGLIGYQIDITIAAPGGTAQVGHIVPGRNNVIGSVLNDAGVDLNFLGKNNEDPFGYEYLVRRGFTRTITIPFICPTNQARRVQKIIGNLDATATAFSSGSSISSYGVEGLGYPKALSQPLSSAGMSQFTLTMKTIK